ncbi:putative transposase [Trichonephila clavipes]|nr:putative transposase [Trichonephila clavipes]
MKTHRVGQRCRLNLSRAETSSRCDEAHFRLNGYVNKQDCRIWSEANPQVYVEKPLHPEKLTVWCALWAGGILLQKR